MNRKTLPITGVLCGSLVLTAAAATHYVDLNSPSPTPPYTTWSTAATNIQDAIDAAVGGDLILVTNGVYETGGKVLTANYTNRIAISQPMTVRSVNGPAVTMIRGAPGFGPNTARCAYLNEGATLSGFTLADGGTLRYAWPLPITTYWGGGVFCVSGSAVLTNCIITGCAAYQSGGGAYSGTLIDCEISGNYASDHGGGVFRSSLTRCRLISNQSGNYGGGADASGLIDCVLTNNYAGLRGGGAYQSSLERCSVRGNSAWWGAGVQECTVNNSLVIGNSAYEGGGARDSTLNNSALVGNISSTVGGGALGGSLVHCTVTGNSAGTGGGTYESTLDNCVVYFNSAPTGSNYTGGTLNGCCTAPQPANGVGSFDSDPQLADGFHLTALSPAIGAANEAPTSGVDIDSQAWLTPPSVGCDEWYSGGATSALSLTLRASHTNVATGFPVSFVAAIEGHATSNQWDFGDGTVVANQPWIRHAWLSAGDYPVVFTAYNDSFPGGVSALMTVHVQPALLHVALGSTNPVAPYSDWATAASNIQDAVDAAFVGSTVLVSNGVYASGARAVGSSSSNRVVIPSLRTVQSVNGPAMTAIQGSQVPVTTNGATAVRCVWLAPNATLSGFTLTNGATATDFVGEGPPPERTAGGAVYAEDASATVWDCVLTGNASAYYGGASFGGTLYQCLINRNWTGGDGGGAYESILNNCCLFNNESTGYGGGALYSTLNNCTVTANFPSGAEACTLNNCIVFGNTPANHESIYGASTLNFCCTSPLPEGGVGNITNTPSFVDPASHNYHLQSDSSCINAGDPSHVPTGPDLEGNPRISGGTVDIGAYEFQSPSSVLSYAWAQQYGLPTDGSADFVDADGEGANNWQEWRADTIPTNAACVLRMATVTNEATGLNVSWESVATRSYWLERAEDMGAVPAFQTIATNLPGVAGSSTYNDTSATNGGTYYYRVGVQ